jgi:hypothetical protein
MDAKNAGGTVLRGADGNFYFIRDELLPAFKMEGEALERTQKELGLKKEGEGRPNQGIGTISYLKADLLDKNPPAWTVHLSTVKPEEVTKLRTSTVMCPWFC